MSKGKRTIRNNSGGRNERKGSAVRTIRVWDLLPGCLLLTLWPCLVHADRIRTGLEGESWYPAFPYTDDYFMHIKSIGFLALAVWMLIILIRKEFEGRREKNTCSKIQRVVCLLVGIYVFMTFLSWVLSGQRQFGFTGLIESFETFPVICGYAVTFFYASCIAGEISLAYSGQRVNPKTIGIIPCSVCTGLLLQELIGISQMTGHDFWRTTIGQSLLYLGRAPAKLDDMTDTGRKVFLSFYNPNYAACYLMLILPILMGLLPVCRRRMERALICVLLAGDVVCLLGTGSDAGIIVFILLSLAAAALLPAAFRKKLICTGMTAGVWILAALAGMLLPYDNPVKNVWKKLIPVKTNITLEDVVPGDDLVRVDYRRKTIFLDLYEETDTGRIVFRILNENMEPFPLREDEKTHCLHIDRDGYGNLAFALYRENDENHLIMYHRSPQWHFIWNGTWHYLNPQGREVKPEKALLSIGKEIPGWLSGRMYIWSVTIPLLKKAVLKGYGPESFPFVFPQNDLVTRSNIGNHSYREIILRPHSLYLQIAMNSGLIAMTVFLILAVLLIIQMLRSISRARTPAKRAILAGIGLSFLSFLLMGIANDSVVAVTPLWMLAAGGCNERS